MKTSPAALLRQVKQEAAKITWPTAKQTTQMACTVIVICLILILFFLLVNTLSGFVVMKVLGE